METNELIKEVGVRELHELIKEDSSVSVVRTYMKRTGVYSEEYRAIYRIDEQLYDSIHLFSAKVSEIDLKGLKIQSLEPNRLWDKANDISEALNRAIKEISELKGGNTEAMNGLMSLWNTIAEDYVLVRKNSLEMGSIEDND